MTFGFDLSIDPSFVRATRHAVAADVFRSVFDLQSVEPDPRRRHSHPRIVERFFRGAHSDVGGGLSPSKNGVPDTLRYISLQWMIDETRASGVPFSPASHPQAKQGNDLSSRDLGQLVHDSRYPPDWFLPLGRWVAYPSAPGSPTRWVSKEEAIQRHIRGTYRDGGLRVVSEDPLPPYPIFMVP